MKKKIIVCALSITMCTSARELRTPIPLLRHILHVEPLCPAKEETLYHWWSGYYQRKTDKARCKVEADGSTNKRTCTLSELMFCKENFAGNEFFANSMAQPPFNILFSTEFKPRYKLIDRGLVLGFEGVKALNCKWNIGGRITMPFRSFQLKNIQGPIVDNQLGAELLSQVVAEEQETVDDDVIVNSYAYRLDFLSQLPVDWVPPGSNFMPLVNYANPCFPNNPNNAPNVTPTKNITISNQNVTNNFVILDIENRNPVTIIKRDDGTVPSQPFSLTVSQAAGLAPLFADGFLVPNNGRRNFDFQTTYLPLGTDTEQQAKFWVVPTVDTTTDSLVEPALIIKDQVDQLIAPAAAIEEILGECSIDFASQKRHGLGDIDTQLFVLYWWNDCSFVEGDFGLRLPTAGVLTTAGRPDQQSLGNNGHPEIALGARIYWHDKEWLLLQVNGLYSFVLNRSELVAVPFEGAQVKNIGPTIPADVSWHYFTGHAELVFEHCFCAHSFGNIRLGYELYLKGKDSISFDTQSTRDCLGNLAKLSAELLEKNTTVHAHKLYTEVGYYREFDCLTLGIFVGGTGLVGGFNTPKDNDWYVGIELNI